MKTMNIKIPLSMVEDMSNNAHINPQFFIEFINTYLTSREELQPIKGMIFNYTFKAPDHLHKAVKIEAMQQDLPMNEFIGRLLVTHY